MFGGSTDLHTGYVESLTKLTDTTLLHFCKCMYVKFYCLQITGNAYHCDNELVYILLSTKSCSDMIMHCKLHACTCLYLSFSPPPMCIGCIGQSEWELVSIAKSLKPESEERMPLRKILKEVRKRQDKRVQRREQEMLAAQQQTITNEQSDPGQEKLAVQ